MNKKSKILKSSSLQVKSIFLFLGRIGGFLVNFLIPIILVRLITKDEFGYFQQFNLMYTTCVIIFTLWLNSSVYYFFPKSSKTEKAQYLIYILFVEAILWIMLLILFFIYKTQFLNYFSITGVENYSWAIILTIFFLFISSILDFLFIVEDKKLHNLTFFPIDRMLKGGLIIFLVSYFSITGIIFSFFIYSFIRFLYTMKFVYKYFKDFRVVSFSNTRIILNTLFKYSLPFGVGLIAQNIALRIDQFVLIDYIRTSQFAIYSIAFYGIPIINFILSSINNVAMPEFTSFAKDKDYVNIVKLWRKIIKKTISVILPALGFFVLFAPEIIILLFTEDYLDSVFYYRIYLFTVLLSASSYGLVLRAANQTKKVMISNVIGLIFTLIAGFLLIPKYQMNGAIFTAMLAYIIPVMLQLYFEFKFLKVKFYKIIPIKNIGINIFITISGLLISFGFKFLFENTIYILISSLIFFFLYVVFFQYQFKSFILQKELGTYINKIKHKQTC